tara:strand:- start:2680 stop:3141 length:462 start_codon:yes stop_codon:yes gene_type:complete
MANIKRARKDTRLEAEAAEFLVLGRLLLEKIAAYKNYTNHPAYDIIAVDPEHNSSIRIQVKSRFRTDWDGFIINNFECEFVVFVSLNRGHSKPKKNCDENIKEPEFYILPIGYVKRIRDAKNDWGKITKNRLKGIEKYRNRWDLISKFLRKRK